MRYSAAKSSKKGGVYGILSAIAAALAPVVAGAIGANEVAVVGVLTAALVAGWDAVKRNLL